MVLSVQLYTVRDVYARDPQGTLRSLKEMGLTHVELAGQWESPEFSKLVKDIGLGVSGTHVGLDALEKDFDKIAKAHEALACRDLIVPWVDGKTWTEKLPEFAERMAAVGAKGKKEGFKIGFHNHGLEIKDGKIHEFFEKAGEDVYPQFDLGWIHVAGEDSVAFIKRYNKRILSVHMKDKTRKEGHADLIAGEGEIDWKPIAEALVEFEVPFGSIEMDNPPKDPLADVASYYKHFKSLGLS